MYTCYMSVIWNSPVINTAKIDDGHDSSAIDATVAQPVSTATNDVKLIGVSEPYMTQSVRMPMNFFVGQSFVGTNVFLYLKKIDFIKKILLYTLNFSKKYDEILPVVQRKVFHWQSDATNFSWHLQ